MSIAGFRLIPLSELHLSKTNPRKVLDKVKLDELTVSIREKGVLVPLLIRPAKKGYEIVAGERRFRAATAVGLKEIPALVRELTDEQALETQVIENLQRDDVHPLDEAAGYAELLKSRKWDVAILSGKIGKSTVYVYNRLALNQLIAEGRKLYAAGKIELGHAQLLSKIKPEAQEAALKALAGEEWVCGRKEVNPEGGERIKFTRSVEWLRTHIKVNILTDLKRAPWALDDADLLKPAGSCVACTKRTGSNSGLFDDLDKRVDSCLDADCWKAKLAAFGAQKVVELKERYGKLPVYLTSNHWGEKINGEECYGNKSWKGARNESECPHVVPGIFLDAGKKYGSVALVCVEAKCTVHHKTSGGGSSDDAETRRYKAEARKKKAEAKINTTADAAVFRALVDSKAVKTLTAAHLREIVGPWMVKEIYHDKRRDLSNALGLVPPKQQYGGPDFEKALLVHIAGLPDAALPAFILALAGATNPDWDASYLIPVAKALKVNAGAIKSKVKAEVRAASAKKVNKPKKGGKGK